MFRPSRIVVILALGVAAAGCHRLNGDGRIEVRNDANVPVSEVVLELGGVRLEADGVASGEAEAFWYSAVEDSSVHASYRLAGEPDPRRCWGDVYVTGGGAERIVLTVLPDGSCHVEQTFD